MNGIVKIIQNIENMQNVDIHLEWGVEYTKVTAFKRI